MKDTTALVKNFIEENNSKDFEYLILLEYLLDKNKTILDNNKTKNSEQIVKYIENKILKISEFLV